MFEYIKGILTDKYNSKNGFFFIIDVNGIGYKLEVSEQDYNSNVELNSTLKIYSELIHREDSMYLCGFLKKETRDIFQYLISVSGVGIKMALALLGQFDTFSLISFVINEDYKKLTIAKGVGPKLAQKIILELKDKLIKANISVVNESSSDIKLTDACKETTSILLSLGYTNEEINIAYKAILDKCNNQDDSEEILREALKYLSM